MMHIIGLMSGTAADGIDAVLCQIDGAPPQLHARILAALTVAHPPALRRRILDACAPGRVDALCALNFELGEAFAAAALEVLRHAKLTPADVDLIASHGQTVWHEVLPEGSVGSTLQIAEAAVIAERTGITTVANFRVRDVAAGGQGAPLVSYLDWLLLRHPSHWRAVQNIGGIGNVTFLPPLADATSKLLAFDTGPGNGLIDAAVSVVTDGIQTYDAGGALAAQGSVDIKWLNALLAHEYYARTPPKTTGRELFSVDMARQLVAHGRARRLSDADIIATITAIPAHSIADAYRRFAPQPIGETLIAGGGRHNTTLLDMLRALLAPTPVLTHEDIGISSDFKEGLLFAVLGYETWHNRIGTLPEQTGARHASILGHITPAANYAALIRKTWGTT
jgi:anhydro-N-acetylmuramic acid kinase